MPVTQEYLSPEEVEELEEYSPTSFKLQPAPASNRASTVVSPFESLSLSCASSQSPLLEPFSSTATTTITASAEENAEAQFVDEHMQRTAALSEWFTRHAARFHATVFPQFFIRTLSTHYPELMTTAEADAFWQTTAGFGNLNDSAIRDLTYSAQCQQLYKLLRAKVTDRPSLIIQLIAALRRDDWYPALADKFLSELNTWRKQILLNSSAATPSSAFQLPPLLAPSPAQPLGPTTMPGAMTAFFPVLPRPTNLLINLPESPSFFTPRVEKAAELKRNLTNVFKDGYGWITLYGMGGSGKTTIAASTVREFYQQNPKKFTDGIFWLNIGKLNEKVNICSTATTTTPSSAAASDNQQNQLLLKMEFLAELLRPFDSYQQFSTTKFDQIQTATFRLKQHFERNPKSLLILDDVWTTDVVENFNFNIPVLVTTREVSVVPRHFRNIVPMSIYAKSALKGAESGEVLLMDEAIKLLYNCLTMPVENELVNIKHLQENSFVREIISNFKGLPFCIPLIANCMEPFYQLARNTDFGFAYVTAMNNDVDYDDPSSRPCFEQWRQLHKNIITNNRGQLDTIHLDTHELVRESIKSLDDLLKERLYDFVIFAEAVPFCVFTTLWSDLVSRGGDVEIMNVLSKLVNKSLVIKIINSSMAVNGGGQPNILRGRGRGESTAGVTSPAAAASFTLHSITLAFLKKELKPEEIKERHSRLITRYLERHCRRELNGGLCEYDYSRLPDDQYIYHNLAYHLYSAQRWPLFAPIFLNLRFATNKVLLVGPSDLLNDYIDYRRYFEGADSEKLSDYHAFIASNSNILCEPNVDIIQIALCMPNSSAVYQEAAALVKQISAAASVVPLNSPFPHHQRTFFDWCNKQNCSKEAPLKLLTFKCLPEVNYATYSPDSRMIATVSGRSLQVWDSTTGREIARLLDLHQGAINHVVFSRNGQFLLTAGEDGTAIMWQYSEWTPPPLNVPYPYADADSSVSSFTQTHSRRSSRSLTVSTLDYIDSVMPNLNLGAEGSHNSNLSESITSGGLHHGESSFDPLYQQQQRRRRSSGNNNSISSGGGGGHHSNSLGGQQSLFIEHATFYLNTTRKLKTDGPMADPPAGAASLVQSVRCGDISSDNRFVLTGNGASNLHLFEVAGSELVVRPLLLTMVDNELEGQGNDDNDDNDADVGGKEVECCAFSGDSRFILGLVANVVYIFSLTEKIRSQTHLVSNGTTTTTSGSSSRNSPARFNTPPGSPSRVRRAGQVSVSLIHRLVHQFKVYNAIFHSSGSSYYPFVFTSSDKFIFEWDLNDNRAQASSFLDSDDDDFNHSKGINLTEEKRKYSTTLSSQHSHSSHSSHLSFVAVSRQGHRIAGFEHTRNEIYLWNRGDGTANWGFGSRSPSPVSGGCCPSSVLLRCQPNIVSLAFSSDSERLLGCCRSGEVTVWNVGKNVTKSSIVDLKNKFAVAFADKEKDDSVRVLTIDTKGFLRLFSGLEGDEDRQFSQDLRAHLSAFTDVAGSEAGKLMPVSPLRLNITCCDIALTGEVVFGTNAGEVFYYRTAGDDKNNSNSRLLREMHGSDKANPEIVNHVHFRPGTSTHLISISDRCISFMGFLSSSPSPSTVKGDTSSGHKPFKALVEKNNISLDLLLRSMNKEAKQELFRLGDDQIKLDECRFVAERSWLLFWTTTGHLWVFDYTASAIIYSTYLNNARITSIDLSSVNRETGQQVMVVATSSKSIYPFRIRADNQTEAEPIKENPVLASKVLPRSIRVAPDRTFIIVGDDGGGLARRIGSVEWQVPNAHTGWVHDLVISPDQRFLLSASESVKLWSAFDGTLLQSFMTHGSVNRLVTRFPSSPLPLLDRNQNPISRAGGGGGGDSSGGPKVTVVTVTDASELYILRTLN